MKKILHIIDTTGPGGAETVFIDLACRLPKDKYKSIVLIRGKGWVYEELKRRNIESILMDAKGSFNWRYLKQLAALIRKERIDLIQSHLLGSNVYASLAGLMTGRPVVSTFHGAVDIGENERLKELKFAAINLGSRCIVAVSNHLRENIITRSSLRANKTTVIYNGINTADFATTQSNDLRAHFGWPNDDMIIGSLGNIRPAKGYSILLQSAALLKDVDPHFRFVIAGQGKSDLYDGLLELRKELGLEQHVHFLGFVADPAWFLSNLDLFLLSSTSEGFSIATIQAMAASLPVLVTRSGGPEEIVTHGENGWMIDSGSPHAIAEALLKLAADTTLAARLAKKGKEHANSSFDIASMLSAYEKIYVQLLTPVSKKIDK